MHCPAASLPLCLSVSLSVCLVFVCLFVCPFVCFSAGEQNASLGWFLKGDEKENDYILISKISITDTNNGIALNLNLLNLVPQLSSPSFYSYRGSLTTPPCHQSVNWIVLENPISTSGEVVRCFFIITVTVLFSCTYCFVRVVHEKVFVVKFLKQNIIT